MNAGTGQSILILVDGDNFYHSARAYGRQANYQMLADYLADNAEQRHLVELVAYVGLPPDTEEFSAQRTNKQNLVTALRHRGFMTVVLEGRAKGPGDFTANIDVKMALDAYDLALRIRPDIVVLVTGDHEFAYVAELLRREGIRVEVASPRANCAAQLRMAANSWIDLEEAINRMPALGGGNGQEALLIGSLNAL